MYCIDQTGLCDLLLEAQEGRSWADFLEKQV